ncbi:NmrA family NAD(P)-binding protein [Neisseriaceae bacterium JH1-16]|nr:NmrA family NAD(P)-binding protein [Neisseriaceae bacterium JH1-16]
MAGDFKRLHLVIGASGAQGGAIARELLSHGEKVRGLVRSENSTVPDGVDKVVADLSDAKALFTAFIGVSHATITIPLIYDPTIVKQYAQNIADAAIAAGVERLVFNANTRLTAEAIGVAGIDTRNSAEKILRASGIPTICLQPAVYLENLLAPGAVAAMREHGELHYPLPDEISVSWISLSDLARAVYRAHQLDTVADQSIAIGSAALTGKQLADELSASLGRTIAYKPLDPALFERAIAPFLGAEAAAGVAGLYHWAFQNPTTRLLSAGLAELQQQLDLAASTPKEWAARQPSLLATA